MKASPLYWINKRWFRVLQHVLFWAASYYILLRIFRSGPELQKVDYIYAGLFHIFLLPPVYLNLERFVYQLRVRYGWWLYALKLLLVIGLFSWLSFMFFQDWSASLFPGYYFISYYTWAELAIFIFIYIAITTLIKGTRSWFTLSTMRAQLQEIEKQKAEMELRALKSQINPHFLFNTLNGIYSMTLNQDKRLPLTVLQLSGLMRYFLYEGADELVPLEKELSLLKDYIELQKIRLGSSLEIKQDIKGEVKHQRIAPLLLITFVENAFKHGDKENSFSEFIRMEIDIRDNWMSFGITNKKGRIDDMESEDYGGIGLDNVRRRLQLLYPDRHKLVVQDQDGYFKVNLQLELYEAALHHH